MKSKDPEVFGPFDWPQSGRPQQPYRLDPVTITGEPLAPFEPKLVDPTTQPYISEPVHAEILRLAPGAGGTFVGFATRLGLQDFHDWAGPAAERQWAAEGSFKQLLDLLERYDSGFRSFTIEQLHDAWGSLPEDAVRRQTHALKKAFRYAETHSEDPTVAARGVIGMGWEIDAFKIDFDLEDVGDKAIIYERPQHIWSRAWFELVDGLREERLPKTCVVDGEYFVPTRRNRKYCSDRCRNLAYDRKRSRDPERRESQSAAYLRRKAQQRGSGNTPSSVDTEE